MKATHLAHNPFAGGPTVTLECNVEEAIVLKALLGGVSVDTDLPNRWSLGVVTAHVLLKDSLDRLGADHDSLKFNTFFKGSVRAL